MSLDTSATLTILGIAVVLAALAVFGGLIWYRRTRGPALPLPDATGLIRDLDQSYQSGACAHPVRHTLDVFAPAGGKKLPVLLFIHGGGWMMGNKSSPLLGIYDKTGETFARLGMVVVMANYRLWPTVRHPENVKDVASAFAWAREHAARYGGDPDNIFVGGHSAGGHLAALLATDQTYLAEHGMSPAMIRGAIIVSGVYRIGDFVARLARIPVVRYFGALGPVFGSDPEQRRAASPITYVTHEMPPFLVLYADGEWYQLEHQAAEFLAAAAAVQARVESHLVAARNHVTIMSKARHAQDPVILAAGAFIERYRKRARPPGLALLKAVSAASGRRVEAAAPVRQEDGTHSLP